jgi:hypothetical protein
VIYSLNRQQLFSKRVAFRSTRQKLHFIALITSKERTQTHRRAVAVQMGLPLFPQKEGVEMQAIWRMYCGKNRR